MMDGLSPPTRGNPPAGSTPTTTRRSIPAHAGEPGDDGGGGVTMRVYPRPRGGTQEGGNRVGLYRGLSPPTRGNRLIIARPASLAGSIPAHAGEPSRMWGLT